MRKPAKLQQLLAATLRWHVQALWLDKQPTAMCCMWGKQC
jgi:hypothetical protein